MKDGFRVIDADRHIIEPSDLFDRYLDAPFRGRVQIGGRMQTRRLVDGVPVSDADRLPRAADALDDPEEKLAIFSEDRQYLATFGHTVAAGFSPAANLADMDREGVDVGVHFPTIGLYIIWRDGIDPQLAAAICRAYNNWLAEYCSHDPARLKGVMLIPLQDPKLAVAELRRAKEELGLCGIFWRPNPLDGRTFTSPDYFPIYEAASELGVPICVHEGARTVLPQAGRDRYSEFTRHIVCHPFEQMLACLQFCADGVLEQFPRLQVAFLESGCGWVPFWLERADEHWEHYSLGRARTTPQPPSYYFKRQCVVSTEAGEELIETVVEHVGDDRVVLATDYPHPDAVGKFPERTVGDLTRNAALPAEVKRKILWDTPARLYGITTVPATARDAAAAST